MRFTKQEKKMLIEAAKSFREADKDFVDCESEGNACGMPLNKETIKRWDSILRKLRARKKRG